MDRYLGQSGFSFTVNRPNDLVVMVRLSSGLPMKLRRMQLFYTDSGALSSFQGDVTDPQFQGSHSELSNHMLWLLLKEVKSRIVSRDEFFIWFYSEDARDFIHNEAEKLCGDDKNWRRFLEALIENSRITEKTTS